MWCGSRVGGMAGLTSPFRLPGLFLEPVMNDTIRVNDTDVVVVRNGETRQVLLRIGKKDYDITEQVYDAMAVQAAIQASIVESMETRAT